MRRSISIIVVLLALGLLLPSERVDARSWPYLFGPRSLPDRLWAHDRSNGPWCVNYGAICDYIDGSIHTSVLFSHNRATKFMTSGYKNTTSPRYWYYLTALLPPGTHRTSCRVVNPSDMGGPAKACLYSYHGKTLIVAQYLYPRDINSNEGVVDTVLFNASFSYLSP